MATSTNVSNWYVANISTKILLQAHFLDGQLNDIFAVAISTEQSILVIFGTIQLCRLMVYVSIAQQAGISSGSYTPTRFYCMWLIRLTSR